MTKPLNTDFIVELCKFIARRWQPVSPEEDRIESPDSKREYFWHGAASTWEAICYSMWALGIAYAADSRNDRWEITFDDPDYGEGNWYHYFSIVSPKEVESTIDFTNLGSGVKLWEILASAVELATDFGGLIPSARIVSFKLPNPEYKPLLEALFNNGYLSLMDDEYWWTDKIAPIMIELFEWDYSERDAESVDWPIVEYWLDKIDFTHMRQISRQSKHLYLSPETNDHRVLTWELLMTWDGERFNAEPKPRELMNFDDAITIAEELLKRFAHNDQRLPIWNSENPTQIPKKTLNKYHYDCWIELE